MLKRIKRRTLGLIVGWLAAFAVLILRMTCRIRIHNDPRPSLRSAGVPYLYCVLHAHQVMATIGAERGTAAMVSQSADGDLIAPALRISGIKLMRGSNANQRGDRGGRAALGELTSHLDAGHPVCIAVDGPRGPRGRVHKGIAYLAQHTAAAVIVVVPVARQRWILRRTWDRFQIPKPFSRIDGYYGAPLTALPGERLESFRRRIEEALLALERQHDPEEAEFNHSNGPQAAAA